MLRWFGCLTIICLLLCPHMSFTQYVRKREQQQTSNPELSMKSHQGILAMNLKIINLFTKSLCLLVSNDAWCIKHCFSTGAGAALWYPSQRDICQHLNIFLVVTPRVGWRWECCWWIKTRRIVQHPAMN